MEVDKIIRTLLTLGGGVFELAPNVRNVLIILSIPCLRGVLEFVPRVSNVLIICPLTRGQLEHSKKTWKWTK
jgi:hypothetical protein